MKKIIISTLFLLIPICLAAQLKSQVNECFELTSIAFRLAGAKEYMSVQIPEYTNEIDKYFAKYSNHALISYIQEIRKKDGIGYDAVPTATGCLLIENGKIIVNPEFAVTTIGQIDRRWSEESFTRFVELLNDFYRQSKFRHFYQQHASLYKLSEERMNELLKNVDTKWFESMFGDDFGDPLILISLSNGWSNYAFTIQGKEEKNAILMGSGTDKEGLPLYDKHLLGIVLHELLHHFTNPRIFDYWDQMDIAAQVIYPHVKEDMFKLAYSGAKATMAEWFVHLFTVLYFQDHPRQLDDSVEYLINSLQTKGFIWLERSVDFMKYFRKNRTLFATVDDFMPQIVGFIKHTANHFDQILNEFDNRRPYVVETFPATESVTCANVDTIRIRFSEPMLGSHDVRQVNKEEVESLPFSNYGWFEDEYTYVLSLDKSKLETGKTYGTMLNRAAFQSKKTYPMKGDYEYTFKIE